MTKIIQNLGTRAVTVTTRVKNEDGKPTAHTVKTVLDVGETKVADKVHSEILAVIVVQHMVAEGMLRFPDDKKMEAVYGKRVKDAKERLERLSAIQEDRKKGAEERSNMSEADIAALLETNTALTAQNETMLAQMSTLADRLAELEKAS